MESICGKYYLNGRIKVMGVFLFIITSHLSYSQSRMYLMTSFNGGTEELGAWYYDSDGNRLGYLTRFGKPGIELALEKRIAGSLYAYVGMNYTQFESAYHGTSTSPYQSQVNQSYISMPLMLRINAGNLNVGYFDFGVMPTYLAKADLKESDTFDPAAVLKDEGDVAKYIPRFGIMYKISTTFAIRRFMVGYYLAVNLAKTGTGDLPQYWKVNSSIYMDYDAKPVWATYGLHCGFRIK